MAKAKLITPYGGKLVNLVVEGKEREDLLARASKLPSIKITMRNLCDLELIASGGFSPLTTFMGKADYERVLHEMRLAGSMSERMAWTRSCPRCGAPLTKLDPREPWTCRCGWGSLR